MADGMWVRGGNPFLAGNLFLVTKGYFLRRGVAPLDVDGAVELNFVFGRNDIQFAMCIAEEYSPNEYGYEFEILFAVEISPVDTTNDGPEDGRVFGDHDIRAIGGVGDFLDYRREGDLSSVGSPGAGGLGVDFAKKGLVRL